MSPPDLSRRSFLRGNVVTPKEISPLRPPWAIKEKAFIEKCTRCDDCIQVCPEKILVQGDAGFPTVDFKRGECTFCFECAKACQTGALSQQLAESSSKKRVANAWQLDVRFNHKCLSMNAVVCRVCGECCDAEAINFKLKVGGISEPQIALDDCTGCGACLSVCPVDAVDISFSGS